MATKDSARRMVSLPDGSKQSIGTIQKKHRAEDALRRGRTPRAAAAVPEPRFKPVQPNQASPERSFTSVTLAAMDTDEVFGRLANGQRANPFMSMRAASTPVLKNWVTLFDSPENSKRSSYYSPVDGDPRSLVNEGESTSDASDTAPAPITLSPTATMYPKRPRTVAAGYDEDRGVMTVVFRDGTYYNYYGVNKQEWDFFRRSNSKGPLLSAYFDDKTRGYASGAPVGREHVRAAVHKASRTAQRVAQSTLAEMAKSNKTSTILDSGGQSRAQVR